MVQAEFFDILFWFHSGCVIIWFYRN